MAPSDRTDRVRVRFRGGNLDGAELELPPRLSDPNPGQLTVTAGGVVFDRHRRMAVSSARVLQYPRGHRLRKDQG